MNLRQKIAVVALGSAFAAWAGGALGLWAVVSIAIAGAIGYALALAMLGRELQLAGEAAGVAGGIGRLFG